jgi:hypothetical protein
LVARGSVRGVTARRRGAPHVPTPDPPGVNAAQIDEERARRVAAIESDAQHMIEAIREITSVVSDTDQLPVAIAGAVEEQTAVTRQMGADLASVSPAAARVASA